MEVDLSEPISSSVPGAMPSVDEGTLVPVKRSRSLASSSELWHGFSATNCPRRASSQDSVSGISATPLPTQLSPAPRKKSLPEALQSNAANPYRLRKPQYLARRIAVMRKRKANSTSAPPHPDTVVSGGPVLKKVKVEEEVEWAAPSTVATVVIRDSDEASPVPGSRHQGIVSDQESQGVQGDTSVEEEAYIQGR